MKAVFNKNYILTVTSAGLFYICAYMLNSVSGRFVVDSGYSKSMSGVVVCAFTLASFFTRPVGGFVTDTKGRKLAYILGGVLCTGRSLILIFSQNIWFFLLARVIFGSGYSFLTTAGSTIVCDVTQKDLLSQAIAFYGITGVISQAVAPGIALWLYEIGFLWLAVALLAGIVAVTIACLFIKYSEKDHINPQAKFGIYEKTALTRSAVIFPFAVATASVYSFVPVMAQERKLSSVGIFFLICAGALMVSRVFNGKFLDKFGVKKVFYTGGVLFTLGFAILAFSYNMIFLVISALLYGLGAGFVHPVINTRAVSRCDSKSRGLATGTFMMSQDLGMTVGALLWGFVSENLGFTSVYLISAAMGVAMVLLYKRLLSKM